jgi:aldehyde dehydrogenase family 7 protein A1
MLARKTTGALNAQLKRSLSSRASTILDALDIPTSGSAEVSGVYDGTWGGSGDILESKCPATGEVLARVKTVRVYPCRGSAIRANDDAKAAPEELRAALDKAREAYLDFRHVPAPKRGEILRQIREALALKVGSLGHPYKSSIH